MESLAQKKILLGVTGGIAAYKCAELIRRLKDHQVEVKVVMTDAAKSFITPLTLQAVSGNPIHDDLLDPSAEAAMGHIELARWADLIVIAPASADFIARLATGMGNDLLTTLCLATHRPVAVAPAMNQGMWSNPATQDNIATLSKRNIQVWGPASGDQACGEVGMGRMHEPAEILTFIAEHFTDPVLAGKKITITAGPTREAIDPVRFISNHSSGKMGFAIAAAAANAGATVTLVAGPVALPTPSGVARIDVASAQEMYDAVHGLQNAMDIFIATAAVADYRPASAVDQKIKKDADTMQINLIKNPDILASVAAWENKPFCVGFAAETQNVLEYAQGKFKKKNLDMIAANDVSQPGIGFNSDENALTVIWPDGHKQLERNTKTALAKQLVELIAEKNE